MGLDAYIYTHDAPDQVAYWRKNHKLEEWMANRWRKEQSEPDDPCHTFNLERLYFTPELLDNLAEAVRDGDLGFEGHAKKEFLNDLLLYKDDIEQYDRVIFYTSWW